jgi:hypothetical protein
LISSLISARMARVSAGISTFELSPSESMVSKSNAPVPAEVVFGPRNENNLVCRQFSSNYNSRTLKTAGEFQENLAKLIFAAGARRACRSRAAKFLHNFHA